MLLLLVLLALGGLYAVCMKPEVAGFLYDDGMYLMAAQALADGHGYRLMGIVEQPLLYKYPPLYPMLLAGLLKLTPAFPANIAWLKAFNIALSLVGLGLLFYYARKHHQFPVWMCLGLVLWLGTHGYFVDVSTELMSEPLFLTLSLLSIVVAERTFQPERNSQHQPYPALLLLILLSVAAFYCRTMGLVLIVAVAGWLFLRQYKREALLYAGACLLLVLPWFWWSAQKADSTYAIGDFLVRSFQETYFQSFRMDLRYEYAPLELYWNGIRELVNNFATYFFPLLDRLYLGQISPLSQLAVVIASLILMGGLGYHAYCRAQARQISLPGLYIGLYLLILPAWSFYKCYSRFLIVMLPLFLIVLLHALSQRWSTKVSRCLVAGLMTVGIVSNLIYISPLISRPKPNDVLIGVPNQFWDDYQMIFRFLRENTPSNAILYTDNGDDNYFYSLNTQRKTLDHFLFLPLSHIERHCPQVSETCLLGLYQQRAAAMRELLKRSGASYYIHHRVQVMKLSANSGFPVIKKTQEMERLIQQFPKEWIPIAQSPDGWITVYQFKQESS